MAKHSGPLTIKKRSAWALAQTETYPLMVNLEMDATPSCGQLRRRLRFLCKRGLVSITMRNPKYIAYLITPSGKAALDMYCYSKHKKTQH